MPAHPEATLSSAPSPPWWRPDRHALRRPHLLARARLTRAVRDWFEAQDFIEVQTASLQVSPGGEAHLHGFRTELLGTTERREMWLHTSPELACKKLLAAGERAIFTLGPAWRNGERGALHHPEFTMLEWYRAGADYEAMMTDCTTLLALAADTTGAARLCWRERDVDPRLAPERISVAEAFAAYSGIDLLASVSADGETDREALAHAARAAGVRVADDDSWADVFSKVLVEKVEPQLGNGRATILYDYPVPQAALARVKPGDPRLAERFELYACGVELANAFSELTDPVQQRMRFEAEAAEKLRVYGERHPLDEDFLAALDILPPASGCALGFERLVMLASGAEHIEQVVWTPLPALD